MIKIDPSKLTKEEMEELSKLAMDGVRQRILTDDDFESEMRKEIKNLLDDVNKDKDDHILARLLAFGFKDPKDGKRPLYYVAFADMPEPEKRREAFRALGGKLVLENKGFLPLYVIFVTEAWTRSMTPEEAKEREKTGKMVSEYDDKKECFIVSGITIDGRERVAQIMFTRDKDNNIIPEDKEIEFMTKAENYLLRNFMHGAAIANQVRNENKKDEEAKK